jgi:Ser-tRNA(Ala) deacylase AlaX
LIGFLENGHLLGEVPAALFKILRRSFLLFAYSHFNSFSFHNKNNFRTLMSSISCAQRNSYAREGLSNVISCNQIDNDKYEVILDDSVLYAEGGGQPCDLGTINDLNVYQVDSAPNGVKVILSGPLEPSSQVHCKVDWNRRYDFMQHHTCQHLLSAVANRMYQAETAKWELGSDNVAVDFQPTDLLTANQLNELENADNEEIKNNHLVTWNLYKREEFHLIPFIRGIPKGAALDLDELRIVTINNIDSNPCGGTHLNSTSEIQLIKIISCEKDKGLFRIRFICGNRIINYLNNSLLRDNKITKLLSVSPNEHYNQIELLINEKKDLVKNIKSMSEEYAKLYGMNLLSSTTASLHSSLHSSLQSVTDNNETQSSPYIVIINNKPLATLQFLQNVGDTILSINSNVILLLCGSEQDPNPVTVNKGKSDKKKKNENTEDINVKSNGTNEPMVLSGPFILYGPSTILEGIKTDVYACIEGRGGGRPGKIQGQGNALHNMNQIQNIINEYLNRK